MDSKNSKPVTLAVVGAGSRGTFAYAPYALEHPAELKITAVAEPNDYRRRQFAEMYGIPEGNQFSSWEDLLENHRADGVLIANQDADHYAPILQAMEGGWNILAEKPVTNSREEARTLLDRITAYDKVFLICHVLRYTPFFLALKEILRTGTVGEIISIQHNENVGHFHQAHSFVRGHWRRKDESSPMILAKCCHDLDILNWLMEADCLRLSSFGSLSHFREENAPPGAPERCLDGCPAEEECPYSASRYFEEGLNIPNFARVVRAHGETEDLKDALAKTPYGRCVYRCDNDVVDHQVMNLEYEEGRTVAFTMAAFSNEISRTMKLMGTRGEIRGHMEANKIEITDFRSGSRKEVVIDASGQGHGGGDEGITREFIRQVRHPDREEIRRGNRQGMLAHLMAFAAEEARLSGKVVTMEDFNSPSIY